MVETEVSFGDNTSPAKDTDCRGDREKNRNNSRNKNRENNLHYMNAKRKNASTFK